MLRGRPEDSASAGTAIGSAAVGYPTGEAAMVTEEKPSGILFYRAREGFYYPYALLQGMRFTPEKVTISFTLADVVVTGEGLHELYVRVARHEVARIVEQHPRNQQAGDGTIIVTKIEELIR